MIDLNEIIRQLTANAQAMRALVGGISAEQARWKPDPETWSMQEVMAHVYNEERMDFRPHLQEMFSRSQKTWGALAPGWTPVDHCQQALERFLGEREDSLAWLGSLDGKDWDTCIQATFGPENEVLTLSAGEVLVSWVEHDFLHLRQMIELQYAWTEKQAAPYPVRYAGGW